MLRTRFLRLKTQRLLFCTALLLTPVISGCSGNDGPQRVSVAGTVTFDGKPVNAGIIQFSPLDPSGRAAGAMIQKGGTFTLEEQIPPGRYRVVIRPPMPPNPGAPVPETPDIPAKYRTEEETDLTVEVQAGSNSIELPMKSS